MSSVTKVLGTPLPTRRDSNTFVFLSTALQIFLVMNTQAFSTTGVSQGTATRFYTDELPVNTSTVTVRDSKAGKLMPSVANGYIGTVIYSDAIHVSGVFNGKANPKKRPIYPVYFYEHAHRARLPSSCAIEFTVLGVSGKSSYALDVGEGVFYRWFRADNSELTVEQRIYAHRSRKHLLVVEISASNSLGRSVTLNITNKRGDSSADIEFVEVNAGGGAKAALGKVNTTEEDGSVRTRFAMVWSEIPSTITIQDTASAQTWYFITAIATSLDTKFEPLTEAMSQWNDALRDNTTLLNTHKKAWSDLWDSGKIDVEGNLELAQSIHGSMYYLLSSTRADWPYGLSPGGLPGGEEYMGHTFWDQDIWMYPALVLLHPDLARASLRYRYDRLPAARRIARKYGYKGAMFPWESAFTGMETSPGEVYGKHQNHITGDIAFAAKLYWWVTKDRQWLREIGFQLAYQTAEYWASRVEFRSETNNYVINHVMPPDEYQYPVNNSVYTNAVAKLNLEFATKIGQMLGKETPSVWSEIAAKMYIPFDDEKQYHPEYEGYNLTITVKQADTILIGYPLMYDMSTEIRNNDLKYYEERTDPNGPAMTHAMFAIGWLELGEEKRATKPFFKNYENIEGPFKIWTERRKRRGAVNFITGAGGFLQAVIYGYGGFRLRENQLDFSPTLPPTATKLTITGVNYLGSALKFAIEKNMVEIALTTNAEIAPPLEIVSGSRTYKLEVGKTVSLARGKGNVRMRREIVSSQAASFHSLHYMCMCFMGFLSAMFAGLGKLSFI